MKKYEYTHNVYVRNSTRKNSKWRLEDTGSRILDEEWINKTIADFNRCPYEKSVEVDGKKTIYTSIVPGGLKKNKIIIEEV